MDEPVTPIVEVKVPEPETKPEPMPEPKPVVNVNVGVKQEPTYEDIEKPKVNIEVDSVVVNNHTNTDDFFDDFFGGEDE